MAASSDMFGMGVPSVVAFLTSSVDTSNVMMSSGLGEKVSNLFGGRQRNRTQVP